ncbi:hypothetical protein D068_cds24310 [Bacillus atrophaeus UCMB-5137]|nr:hypothetical protein D068_cds24310 [Bacillus atrophaeus UCMB-5137]
MVKRPNLPGSLSRSCTAFVFRFLSENKGCIFLDLILEEKSNFLLAEFS